MSDQMPGTDRPYRVDAAWNRAVFARRTGQVAAPLAALQEIRRVLKSGGVIGIVDGSSTITFRYPTNSLLDKWDRLRVLEREHNVGRPSEVRMCRQHTRLSHENREDLWRAIRWRLQGQRRG